MSTVILGYLYFLIFWMDEKEKLTSFISEALYFFKLDSLLFLMIYPYKLMTPTFINPLLTWLCALGSHIGVKMTIFDFTPQMKAGWNISWESSVPFKHIGLFLRVNKEGLCDGTIELVKLCWVISSIWFLEWRKLRH